MAFGMALHGKSDIISQTTVNFNYFLSVKNMLEEGLLGHDHVTLNTTAYYATKQQIDNRKFQFMSRRQSYYINYRSSRKRKKVLSQLEIKGHL